MNAVKLLRNDIAVGGLFSNEKARQMTGYKIY